MFSGERLSFVSLEAFEGNCAVYAVSIGLIGDISFPPKDGNSADWRELTRFLFSPNVAALYWEPGL
jgi:hypothetical protein